MKNRFERPDVVLGAPFRVQHCSRSFPTPPCASSTSRGVPITTRPTSVPKSIYSAEYVFFLQKRYNFSKTRFLWLISPYCFANIALRLRMQYCWVFFKVTGVVASIVAFVTVPMCSYCAGFSSKSQARRHLLLCLRMQFPWVVLLDFL